MRALRCWLLTRALWDGLAGMRERRGEHDPGRVVGDLAVMLADGGDCLADLRAVRDQQPLFGKVAADATAWRVIDAIAADPQLPAGLRGARARGRGNAWNAGARPERMVIDIDAALITVHSEKDGAAGTFKGGFGFHPLLTYLDESREALGWRAAAGQRRRQHRLRPHRGGRPRARAASGFSSPSSPNTSSPWRSANKGPALPAPTHAARSPSTPAKQPCPSNAPSPWAHPSPPPSRGMAALPPPAR